MEWLPGQYQYILPGNEAWPLTSTSVMWLWPVKTNRRLRLTRASWQHPAQSSENYWKIPRGIKVKCLNGKVSQCSHGLCLFWWGQEDLNDFLVILVITEELELKRLTGSGNEELGNESPQFEPEQKKPRAKLNADNQDGQNLWWIAGSISCFWLTTQVWL